MGLGSNGLATFKRMKRSNWATGNFLGFQRIQLDSKLGKFHIRGLRVAYGLIWGPNLRIDVVDGPHVGPKLV